MKFTAHGKQIKRGDDHIADCINPEMASKIADLLNLPTWLDGRADRLTKHTKSGARMLRVIANDIRAGLHEGEGN